MASATTMERERKKVLGNILTDWRILKLPDPYGMKKAVYMPKHQYTDASISVASLKYPDSARAQCLLLNSDIANSLNSKIAEAVQVMKPLDFQHTIVPFLKTSLDTSQEPRPLHLAQLDELYTFCLRSYILRFVRLEPIETNWNHKPVYCKYSCDDCTSLSNSLQDPMKQVGRFSMDRHRRHHLSHTLFGYTDCEYMTERRGSPQIFVVIKLWGCFEQEHREWLARANMLRTHLEELDTNTSLETLLGVEYERIMCLSNMTAAVQVHPSAARNQFKHRGEAHGDNA